MLFFFLLNIYKLKANPLLVVLRIQQFMFNFILIMPITQILQPNVVLDALFSNYCCMLFIVWQKGVVQLYMLQWCMQYKLILNLILRSCYIYCYKNIYIFFLHKLYYAQKCMFLSKLFYSFVSYTLSLTHCLTFMHTCFEVIAIV